ncbi:MAG: hydrogenase maturation nickel metallochaperone HypA [Candidatus Eisenbacteria bacterium]
MHEAGVARSILDIVERTAADYPGAEVRAVHVSVGALAHIDDDALRFAFDALKPETAAGGVELRIERKRLTGACRECGEGFETDSLETPCPGCGGGAVDWGGEHETHVIAVDVVEDDPGPDSGTMKGLGEDR